MTSAKLRARDVLRELLSFVRPHARYAVLTLAFGALGFVMSFAYPWIIGNVVDILVLSRGSLVAREHRLLALTAAAAVTAVVQAVVVYGRGHFNVHLGDAVVTDIRRKLFEHLQSLSLLFFTKERTGAILTRLLYDVQEAPALLYVGLIVVGLDAFQLALAFALLTGINAKLTLACALLFPLYGVVFVVMNPAVRRASDRVRAHLSKIAANLSEHLAGQSVVKTCNAEAREAARFGRDAAHHHELVLAQSHQGHLVASWGEVLVHAGTTIVVGYGGWLAIHGEMTPGMMTRFLGYILLMFGPVRRFAELNITYQSSVSAMNRVFHVLHIRPAVAELAGARDDAPTLGHVRFEDVHFRYSNDHDEARARLEDTEGAGGGEPPWVLRGISLEAPAGVRVAVVGSSGAGKSTLVTLLPRLYDVTRGRITVDGVDVREYSLRALRSAIAVVAQDTFVFAGSVYDNIAYARPEASADEVMTAARLAYADEFVSRLPERYATRIGERGVNLSGGQRQRISIARALLRNPKILILDEATSALDAESELIVHRALEVAMDRRTCFVVAHRLSTVRNASRILVLRDGAIAEAGTHDDLLARGGRYASLVRHQR